jgi:Putative transposase
VALPAESIPYPVPHRHFVFGIPKMLRPYFRYDRDFAQRPLPRRPRVPDRVSAHEPGPARGVPGIVMAIHTFGEYLDFHFHLHALVADGLFRGSSTSCPSPVSSPWRNSSAHG